MRTTITLRDDLLKMARLATGAKSVTAAVNRALEDWARRKRIDRILEKAGKVRFDGNLDELRVLELRKAEKLYGKHSR